MGATGPAGSAHCHQHGGVGESDLDVVADDGQRGEDVVEEGPTRLTPLAPRDLDADTQLGDGDGGDRRLVVVADQAVEIDVLAFGPDEDVRVEQQERQNRSSVVTCSRSSATSWAQPGSTGCRRSSRLTSAPDTEAAGPSWAITRPRRTIV